MQCVRLPDWRAHGALQGQQGSRSDSRRPSRRPSHDSGLGLGLADNGPLSSRPDSRQGHRLDSRPDSRQESRQGSRGRPFQVDWEGFFAPALPEPTAAAVQVAPSQSQTSLASGVEGTLKGVGVRFESTFRPPSYLQSSNSPGHPKPPSTPPPPAKTRAPARHATVKASLRLLEPSSYLPRGLVEPSPFEPVSPWTSCATGRLGPMVRHTGRWCFDQYWTTSPHPSPRGTPMHAPMIPGPAAITHGRRAGTYAS